MTPRELASGWLTKNGLTLVVYLLTLGVAWGSLSAAVSQKAEKSEVTELTRDIKAIKALICKDHPGDSLCR